MFYYVLSLICTDFHCFGKKILKAVLLRKSSSILRIKKLHRTSHKHEGEHIMTEFQFKVNYSFKYMNGIPPVKCHHF